MTGMRQAVAFLTPLGGPRAPSSDALRWFPAIGAGLGLALGGIWWSAGQLWPAPVAAALVVAADVALTGMLHVDGLMDSADGLLPPLSRDRRLEVMAAPDVGAFGMATGVVVVLLRWAALAWTTPDPLLLAALWCASRTAMVVTAGALPYVRPGGLAAPFVGGRWVPTGVAGALAALALGVWWRPLGARWRWRRPRSVQRRLPCSHGDGSAVSPATCSAPVAWRRRRWGSWRRRLAGEPPDRLLFSGT